VINNIQAPTYKMAKYINKKMNRLLNVPNTYTTRNSQEIAEEIKSIKINENSRILTLDMKDLYVNLSINGIIKATRHWLHKNNNNRDVITQLLNVIKTIMQRNYFQFNDTFYQPEKGIAMGSPILGAMVEIYLQYVEANYIKQWWETEEILYYKNMWMTF